MTNEPLSDQQYFVLKRLCWKTAQYSTGTIRGRACITVRQFPINAGRRSLIHRGLKALEARGYVERLTVYAEPPWTQHWVWAPTPEGRAKYGREREYREEAGCIA